VRCFSCHCLSLTVICQTCQERLFRPTIKKRTLGSLEVYSFYSYSTIESLLLLKHKPQGYRVFDALAKMSLKPFIELFTTQDARDITIIGIDEKIKNGYSHIATLTKQMQTPHSHPQYASLLAQSSIKYAGKSRTYRENNPRNFIYTGEENIDAILIDDIITTGATLTQAYKLLQHHNVRVEFALVLADVRE